MAAAKEDESLEGSIQVDGDKAPPADGQDGDVEGESRQEARARKSEKIKEDISGGPLKDRHCTDSFCILIYIFFMVAWLGLAGYMMGTGKIEKLYYPRDYRGDYCGLAADAQFNGGRSHEGQSYVIKMMNVSGTTQDIAKELVCSSAAETELRAMSSITADELEDYMCGCCKTPCPACKAVLGLDDHTSTVGVASAVTGKMTELTDPSSLSLYSTQGANGGSFSKIFYTINKYFVDTCVIDCNAVTRATSRNYTYTMDFDNALRGAWEKLKANGGPIGTTIETGFTFKALPESACNYEAKYCVPFPGMTFTDPYDTGFCMFQLSSEVAAMFPSGATAYMSGAYGQEPAEDPEPDDDETATVTQAPEDAEETENPPKEEESMSAGSVMADLWETLLSTILVLVFSFISGFILVILIRLFVGIVVWLAIIGTVAFVFGSGIGMYVRAGQCEGTSMYESGQAYTASATSAYSIASGEQVVDMSKEKLTGKGEDYVGVQTKTVTGRTCQRWDSQSPHPNSMATKYPAMNLTGAENYCRNPNGAIYIWCYTTDATTRWQLCSSLDTMAWDRECPAGYVVKSKTQRKALDVCGTIFMFIGLILTICICCFRKTIVRTIGILKTAAMFVTQVPRVLLVPIVQVLCFFCWLLLWIAAAASAVGNVPDGYTPTDMYESYSEAFGTYDVPGKCRDKWPEGYVYKYGGDLTSTNDVCSGNLGDVSGITPKCWACSQPRYVFSEATWFNLFMLFWNNAMLIACGQMIIAGATAFWFFQENEIKGTGSPLKGAIKNTFRYHFGSICFGSFILAVVKLIKWILYYFQKQAELQKNRVMELILKILGYLITCFERCLEFLTKNAYIQIAIVGKNFCTSAKNAFFLILRNMGQFGALTFLGNIIEFLGKAFIVSTTTIFGYVMLGALDPDVSPIAPLVLYLCIGWLVGSLYMTVFSMAIDSVLQCVLCQEENKFPGDFIPSPLKSVLPGYTEPPPPEPDKE